jgi:hypothetical protein
MATFYKGFLIKQATKTSPEAAPKFIATLQGVRFTAFTVTALHEKIDRNAHMISEMRSQEFKSKATVNSAMFDPSDNLLDAYEIAEIVASYVGRGEVSHAL